MGQKPSSETDGLMNGPDEKRPRQKKGQNCFLFIIRYRYGQVYEKEKSSVTVMNDSLNSRWLNVGFGCALVHI